MKVVITGAAGYIGSKLCETLTHEYPKIKIYAFDNLMHNQWYMVRKTMQNKRIRFYHEDVTQWSDNLQDKMNPDILNKIIKTLLNSYNHPLNPDENV